MKILSIDASSKIGWSILEDKQLLLSGVVEVPTDDLSWPWGIFKRSNKVAEAVNELVMLNIDTIDHVIIERANSSSFRNSQNFIDWFHFAILQISVQNQWDKLIVYIDTATWRKKLNLKLTDMDKKHNKLIKKGIKTLPVKGRISKKHLSVRMANELFGLSLKLKDNDKADSMLCGYSFFI